MVHENIFLSLARSLLDDTIHAAEPTPERANNVLTILRKEFKSKKQPITIAIL